MIPLQELIQVSEEDSPQTQALLSAVASVNFKLTFEKVGDAGAGEGRGRW